MIHQDGRRETRRGRIEGQWYWQLDTGYFFEHPTLGPLWYQQNGWSCQPDSTTIGKLCARVKP